MEQYIYHSEQSLAEALFAFLNEVPLSDPVYVVMPSGEGASYMERLIAHHDAALSFGTTCTTLRGMVQQRYGLFGSGLSLVEEVPRIARMAGCLQETLDDREGDEHALPATPGSIQALLQLAGVGCCYPGFLEKVQSNRYRLFAYEVLSRYFELLASEGCLEYGTMLEELLQKDIPVQLIVVDPGDLLPLERAYLEFHNATVLELDEEGDAVGSAPQRLTAHLYRNDEAMAPDTDIRFALADGIHVEHEVVARTIAQCIEDGFSPKDIYVACGDEKLYTRVLPVLATRGIPSKGTLNDSFTETVIGRVYMDLRYLVERFEECEVGDGSDRPLDDVSESTVADLLFSPCCPASNSQAYRVDAQLKSAKRPALADGMKALKTATDAFDKPLKAIRANYDPQAVAHLMESYEHNEGRQRSQLGMATAVLDLVAELFSSPHIRKATRQTVSKILVLSTVTTEVAQGDTSRGAVTFGDLQGLSYASYPCVIICGLTADTYSMEEEGKTLRNTLADLGYTYHVDTAANLRKRFKRAVSHAGKRLVFQRAVCDEDASPLRPSALFEDVCDCFREDITAINDLDEDTGMPMLLLGTHDGVAITTRLGEEDLPLLFERPGGSKDNAQDTRARISCPDRGHEGQLSDEQLALLFPEGKKVFLSASQVERYLRCPYRWFVESKIKPEKLGLAEEAIGIGNFTHGVLESFYQAKAQTAVKRVTKQTLVSDLALLDKVFEEVIEGIPGNREIPLRLATELDYKKLYGWRYNLRDLIKEDAEFLPGFEPAHLEMNFGQDGSITYAGHAFGGRIDRVDVDASGHAVIIDYKGGIGSEYTPNFDDPASPKLAHAQALIYAQIARRSLGLDAIASLYRSYRGYSAKGAYDARVLDPEDLVSKSCAGLPSEGGMNFEDCLDAAEEYIAGKLEEMLSGRIPKDPVYGSVSCQHCPVKRCERMVK